MRRLLPGTDQPITIEQAYATPLGPLGVGGGRLVLDDRPGSRPWIGLSMVASIDGSTVVDGASAGLSSDNDTAVLLQLRSIADVILVGSGTASGEGYGPPKKLGQRIGVVTGRGSVDTLSELFTSGAGFVVTTERAEFTERGVDVIRCGIDEVDLAAAVDEIPTVCASSDFIAAEGGPTLNGALAAADLFDELNLSISPALVGGNGPRLVAGATDLSCRFDLEQLLIDDESFVFSRWRRRREPSSP